MSTPPPAVPVPNSNTPNEITIVSHSNLFYWWPVWAVGFVMGFLSLFGGYVVAVVPKDSVSKPVADSYKVEIPDKETKDKTRIVTRKGVIVEPVLTDKEPTDLPKDEQGYEQPHLRVANHKLYGVVFAFVLLMVIVITNVPLRGMWSLLIILLVVMMILIFSLWNLWPKLVELFGRLDIRMTAGGYFLIATVLFAVWLVTFVFFDRQIYMKFTPGQLKVCTEIGGGEKVYDAVGMTLEKQRSDLFRHWILGLGSGDLVVRTSGAQAHQFDLPNVLFIGRKVAQIEDMLKKKSVIETR